MLTLFLVALAVMGTVVLGVALRTGVQEWSTLGASPQKFFAIAVVPLAIAYHTNLLPKSSVLQFGVVALASGSAAACLIPKKASTDAGPRLWGGGSAYRLSTLSLCGVVLMATYLFAVNALANPGLPDSEAFQRLIAVVFWTAAAVVWAAEPLNRRLMTCIFAGVLAACAIVTVVVPAPFAPCNQFKCGALGAILQGPFSSGNFFAMLAALTILLSMGARPVLRWPTFLLGAAVLVATESRTSQLAVILGLTTCLVLLAVTRRSGRAGRLTRLSVVALLPAVVPVVGLLMVYSASRSDLSNRGGIWVRGREVLAGNELFGLGISRWGGYEGVSRVSILFPHSAYLLLLFSGGLIAVVMLIGVLSSAALSSTYDRVIFSTTAGLLVTWLTIGTAEVAINFMSVDGLSMTLLPILAIGRCIPRTADGGVTAGGEAGRRTTGRAETSVRTVQI